MTKKYFLLFSIFFSSLLLFSNASYAQSSSKKNKKGPDYYSKYQKYAKTIKCETFGIFMYDTLQMKKAGKNFDDIYWALTTKTATLAEQMEYYISVSTILDRNIRDDSKQQFIKDACKVDWAPILSNLADEFYDHLDETYGHYSRLDQKKHVYEQAIPNPYRGDSSSNYIMDLVAERALEYLYSQGNKKVSKEALFEYMAPQLILIIK